MSLSSKLSNPFSFGSRKARKSMGTTETGLPALSPKRSSLADPTQQIHEVYNRAGGLKKRDLMNQTAMVEKVPDAGGFDLTPSLATDASGRKALNLNSTVRAVSDLGSRTVATTGPGHFSPSWAKQGKAKKITMKKFENTQEG